MHWIPCLAPEVIQKKSDLTRFVKFFESIVGIRELAYLRGIFTDEFAKWKRLFDFLHGHIVISGINFCRSGIFIGGADDTLQIGGIDKSVIRNPLTDEPYIPGSSLKGKLRRHHRENCYIAK